MSPAATQYELPAFLEASGARPAGAHRYDCPDCGGRRTVSVDEERGLYHCHHTGCEFRGGIGTLRKRLGIRREWLPPEDYRELCRTRERAHEAAERLAAAVHSRCMELLDWLHDLNRLETQAKDRGASEWEALEIVYTDRPLILAELAILENASAADLFRVLTADAATITRIGPAR